MNFLLHNLLWSEGWLIALVLFILLLLVLYLASVKSIWFCIWLLFALFSLYFFRNPERISAADPLFLISPSDGEVVEIKHLVDDSEFKTRISIFLSPLDVHVNWAPTDGVIEEIRYTPGTFKMAFVPKSSDLNERNDILIRHPNGKRIKVRQIAGMVARRIVCWVKQGDSIKRGQKYGMIRFGSRMDIFLPQEIEYTVRLNQRVTSGETIIGRWNVNAS